MNEDNHRSVAGGDPDAIAYGLTGDFGALSVVNEPKRNIREAGDAFAERGESGREETETADRAGVREDGEGNGASFEDMLVPEDDSLRRNSTQR